MILFCLQVIGKTLVKKCIELFNEIAENKEDLAVLASSWNWSKADVQAD